MTKSYAIQIRFNLKGITPEAKRMIDISASQDWWTGYHPDKNGDVEIDVIDYDSLSNDTLALYVKSDLTWSERAREFGVQALEFREMKKDGGGDPVFASVNHPIPNEEYIKNVLRFRGGDKVDSLLWSLRDASRTLFGRVKGQKITGADAMNAIAAEFWQWCEEGQYSPIIPRGRDGGRKPIGEEPMTRHNILATDATWQWLREYGGDNASAGLRRLYNEGNDILP